MFVSFRQELVHDKKSKLRRAGLCILLRGESLPRANEVGGHSRGKHYSLSTYYSRPLLHLLLYTVAAVLPCGIRTKSKLRKSAWICFDLLQQRSSIIMMHPSGHPAARRQRCSHAPIPSRQPGTVAGAVCASTWSLSRACDVRACFVPSFCVMRVENRSS